MSTQWVEKGTSAQKTNDKVSGNKMLSETGPAVCANLRMCITRLHLNWYCYCKEIYKPIADWSEEKIFDTDFCE